MDKHAAIAAIYKEIRGAEAHTALRYLQKRVHDLEIALATNGHRTPQDTPKSEHQRYEEYVAPIKPDFTGGVKTGD